MSLKIASREVAKVTILDIQGRIVLGDEIGDQALDLGGRQVIAASAVGQAHIAADHEAAQARLGEALCLCDAEPADDLAQKSV